MAKKLKTDDIVEKGLFDKPLEETREFLKVVKDLKQEVKELGDELQKSVGKKSPLKDAKDVEKFTNEVKQLEDATKSLTDLEKQEAKLKEKLIMLTKEEAINQAKLRVQVQERNKVLKEEAKEQLGVLSTYQKQSKALNELRKKYKNLVLEQGKNAEGAKELKKEIQELDKALKDVDAEVGQYQRDVGNYEKVNEKAKNSYSSLSGFLLGAVVGSFQKSRTEARSFNLALETVKNSINTFIVQISKSLKESDGLISFGVALFNNLKSLADVTVESNKALTERLLLQDRAIDQIAMFEAEIFKLIGAEEQLQVIADDATRSFAEREKAIKGVSDLRKSQIEQLRELSDEEKGLLRIQEERIGKEEEIAKIQFDLARIAIKDDFIKYKKLEEFNKLNEEGLIKNLKFLEDKKIADFIGLENLENLKNATLSLQQVENERAKLELETSKTSSELKQDRLERDLDILQDGFDNQKTINERIIADEKRTLEERQALLDDTIERGNNSFTRQTEILENLSKAGIDYNELLELDAEALNERIRSLEQSEIIEGRTLKAITDRKTVVQDLQDAQEDLNEAKRQELLQETELNALKDGKKGQQVDKAVRDARIKQLKDQIDERKAAGQETIELELELARLELEIEEEKKEARKKLIQETTTFIENELKKRTDLRTKALNEEIDASKEREQQLRNAAANGNLLAEESIAVEKERQAKLIAEREKALKRQKQIEISLAAINAYSNMSRQGDENALGKTIGDITALLAFANNLPAFEDGGLVTGGEQIVRINEKGQEYVIKHDAVNKYGTDMLDAINTGDFSKMEVNRGSGGQTDFNIMMNQALDKVAGEFKKAVSEIPQQRWSMSEITGGLKEEIEKGNQLRSRHYRKQKRLS